MRYNHYKKSKGQALVELALALALLIPLIFGVFEFGRAMYIKNTLLNAAREGVRQASTSPVTPLDAVTLEERVKACIPFDKTGLAVEITPGILVHGRDTITVTVKLPFHTTVPLVLTQLNGITLKGEASMMYE